MRNFKKQESMFIQPRSLLRLALLSGLLIAPGLAHAAANMTRAEMIHQVENHQGDSFSFEASCNEGGLGSLSVGSRVAHFDDGPAHPPEFVKCLLFGNQDQGRYICTCADLEEPVTGHIPGEQIPSLGDPSEGKSYFESFDELCMEKFNSICGPFPERVKASCSNEQGYCMFSGAGNQREGQLNVLGSECECHGGRAWLVEQNLKKGIALDQSDADALCEAQLASCSGEQEPIFHDFQNLERDKYETMTFACAEEQEMRYDECYISARDGGEQAMYHCECNGAFISGEVELGSEGVASSMDESCTALLDRCKDVQGDDEEEEEEEGTDDWPDDDEEDTEEWPDDDDEEDTEKPSDDQDKGTTWEDIVDALGCRATPTSGFGFQSMLGFAALMLLGGRLRRKRGE